MDPTKKWVSPGSSVLRAGGSRNFDGLLRLAT